MTLSMISRSACPTGIIGVPSALLTAILVAAGIDGVTGVADRLAWDYHARNVMSDRVAPALSIPAETATSVMAPAPTDVALLMVDIDDFSKINAQFGHPAADEVLRHIAEILMAEATHITSTRRAENDPRQLTRHVMPVGRRGGDEFAVLLPGVGTEPAMRTASRICARVQALHVSITPPGRAPITVGGVTVSVGVALHHGVVADPDTALHTMLWDADRALYDAKSAGKNRVRLAS